MQEYLKKSSCFFALIFLLFVIAVSLPGIFETGEFLKDHLDAAYWSFRTDRQVVYLPPAEEISASKSMCLASFSTQFSLSNASSNVVNPAANGAGEAAP